MPPESVSPAAMEDGRSATEPPSFSIISTVASKEITGVSL
jgi:hypothetical protein